MPFKKKDEVSSVGQKLRNHNDGMALRLCLSLFSYKTKPEIATCFTQVRACTHGHFLVKWFINILAHFHFHSPST